MLSSKASRDYQNNIMKHNVDTYHLAMKAQTADGSANAAGKEKDSVMMAPTG